MRKDKDVLKVLDGELVEVRTNNHKVRGFIGKYNSKDNGTWVVSETVHSKARQIAGINFLFDTTAVKEVVFDDFGIRIMLREDD